MSVLDTHTALWLLGAPDNLSRAAGQAIEEAEAQGDQLILSGQSLYEIARGIFRGRIRSEFPVEVLLRSMQRRFVMRSVTVDIAIAAAQLPPSFPSDPFDRMIAATAIVEGVPLITADERIRNSGAVRTIW